MAMTKKNYEAVASAINQMLWHPAGYDPATITAFIVSMSAIFEADNERFDRDRFFQACTKEAA